MLILAVDDDWDDLDVFCDAVMEIDPSVDLICARNGDEALNYLLNKAITFPDYIFLDINMPRVDGRACLSAIRQNRLTKNLSVIMYSTSMSSHDKELFEKLNARFLTKASTYTELLLSLRNIFGALTKEHHKPISLAKI
jgi:CheY-like chemotaxis protein